jgi:hypothetical protein
MSVSMMQPPTALFGVTVSNMIWAYKQYYVATEHADRAGQPTRRTVSRSPRCARTIGNAYHHFCRSTNRIRAWWPR